jgi:hypothetical protein
MKRFSYSILLLLALLISCNNPAKEVTPSSGDLDECIFYNPQWEELMVQRINERNDFFYVPDSPPPNHYLLIDKYDKAKNPEIRLYLHSSTGPLLIDEMLSWTFRGEGFIQGNRVYVLNNENVDTSQYVNDRNLRPCPLGNVFTTLHNFQVAYRVFPPKAYRILDNGLLEIVKEED